MAQFPSLKTGAVLQYPALKAIVCSTDVVRFLDGSEQRFRNQKGILRRWMIRLALLDEIELAQLEGFISGLDGRLGDFSFFDPWEAVTYDHCSLEQDESVLRLNDHARGEAMLWIRQRWS